MSLYYVVRVFEKAPSIDRSRDARASYLSCAPTVMGGEPSSVALTNSPTDTDTKRFLWKEDAEKALGGFMGAIKKGSSVERGQVRYIEITETPVGPVLQAGEPQPDPTEPPQSATEPPSAPESVEVSHNTPVDLDEGERLLAAAGACDLSDDSDHDDYHEAALWCYENARELLKAARERDRLNWLRMNPEGCRAAKDCRNRRKEGYIHCEECLEDPNAGGYFDVYRNHYVEIYNCELERLLQGVLSRFPIQD